MNAETIRYTPAAEVDFNMLMELSEERGYRPSIGAALQLVSFGVTGTLEFVAPYDDIVLVLQIDEDSPLLKDGLRVGHRIRRKFCTAQS